MDLFYVIWKPAKPYTWDFIETKIPPLDVFTGLVMGMTGLFCLPKKTGH